MNTKSFPLRYYRRRCQIWQHRRDPVRRGANDSRAAPAIRLHSRVRDTAYERLAWLTPVVPASTPVFSFTQRKHHEMNGLKMRQKMFATLALGLLPVVAMADGHWLAGGAIGTAQIRESFAGVSYEPSSTSYRIFGGYQFNDYFGFQAGYLSLDSFDESILVGGSSINVSADIDGVTAAAFARMPLGQKFDAHAKIGSFFYDAKSQIDGAHNSASESDVFFGVGLGLGLTDKLSLSLDAERYELSAVYANVYSVGLQVRFR
jgi:OOP family OmpA-OmpF porin